MFCNKCGADNAERANFCQQCGTHFSVEQETRIVAKHDSTENNDAEKKVFSIRPTLLFVKIGYAIAVVLAFLLVVIMVQIDDRLDLRVAWWMFVIAGLALLLIPAYYHLRQKTVLYTLTDSKIEIDEGFIFQNSRNVPLRSIQDVSVSSTLLQRLLGFGNLIIDNASEAGGKIVLKNIDRPKKYADLVLREMRFLDK